MTPITQAALALQAANDTAATTQALLPAATVLIINSQNVVTTIAVASRAACAAAVTNLNKINTNMVLGVDNYSGEIFNGNRWFGA